MFTNLLLALTIATGTATVPGQAPVSTDQQNARPTPFCIAGPVRMRHRNSEAASRTASAVVGQEIAYRPAGESARPD